MRPNLVVLPTVPRFAAGSSGFGIKCVFLAHSILLPLPRGGVALDVSLFSVHKHQNHKKIECFSNTRISSLTNCCSLFTSFSPAHFPFFYWPPPFFSPYVTM